MKLFSKDHVSRLSTSSASELKWNRIIVIDSIGLLNRLYKLGDICYVGGGFGDGVHNILEAAVWGKPVLFGPNHKKFTEAKELLNLGGGISFDSIEHGVARLLELKSDHSEIIRRGRVSKEYVFKNEGATTKILRHLEDSGIFK
jgi:3-deoxy-D-manno-octulosonic-acid transferase